jgi:hypothetical protein
VANNGAPVKPGICGFGSNAPPEFSMEPPRGAASPLFAESGFSNRLTHGPFKAQFILQEDHLITIYLSACDSIGFKN